MNKATAWAKTQEEQRSRHPQLLRYTDGHPDGRIAHVGDDGSLEIDMDHLNDAEALRLGQWLLDIFGAAP